MASVSIDFSIFVPESFGFATGDLTLSRMPSAGEYLDILETVGVKPVFAGFSGLLRVEQVTQVDGQVVLMLEDVCLEDPEDAERFAAFLESELNLFVQGRRD